MNRRKTAYFTPLFLTAIFTVLFVVNNVSLAQSQAEKPFKETILGDNQSDLFRFISRVEIGNQPEGKIPLNVNGQIKAQSFCLDDDCVTSQTGWGSGGGTSYWSLFEGNIYRLDGNVGIGIDRPDKKLEVVGDVKAKGYCIGDECIYNWSSGSGDVSSVSADNSTLTINPTIGVVKASLNLNNNNNWTGQQTFSEYVGIGTSSPLSKLHLFDNSSGPIISLSGLNTNYRGLTTRDLNNNEKWFMGNNDSNNFVIRRNGSVDDLSINSTTGNISFSSLSGSGNRCLYVTSAGLISAKGEDCGTASGGDDLGDHIATQNLKMGNYYISNNGDDAGLSFNSSNNATFSGSVSLGSQASNTSQAVRADRSISSGTGLSGGGNLTANRTLSLTDTGVTPGTYGNSTNTSIITIDAQGRITSANNTPISGSNWNLLGDDVYRLNGNVGIGTSTPNRHLHIYDTTINSEIDLQSVAGNGEHWSLYVNRDDNSFRLWGNDNRLTVLRNGRVGIGTNSPSSTLHVIGNIIANSPSSASHVTTKDYVDNRSLSWNKLNGFPGACPDGEYVTAIGNTLTCTSVSPDSSLWTAGTGSNIYRLSGYVGIGTNSPSSTLHVIGTTTADTFCIGASCIDEWSSGSGDVSSVSADNSTLTINPTIGVVKASLNLNNNNNWTGQQTFSQDIGIGTSSPLSKLHLFDNSSGPIISLSGLNTNYRGLTTRDLNNNEKWFMGNNDSNNFVIRRNGSVDDLSINSTTGNISFSSLSGSGNRCLYVTSAGLISAKGEDCGTASGGDDLGDHIATQNLKMGNYYISNNGDDAGLSFNSSNNATFSGSVSLGSQASNTSQAVRADRSISSGTGLSGGGNLTANRTLSLTDTGVTPGTYGNSTNTSIITIDAQGRITSANNTPISGSNWNLLGDDVYRLNGNVGIGTSTPNRHLHIYDTTINSEIDLQSVAGNGEHWSLYVNRDDNSFRLWGNDNRLTVLRNGRVGIGTNSPSSTLHVIGNIIANSPSSASHVTTKDYVDNRSLSWNKLNGFPGACPDGEYVTAIGNTLTCTSVSPDSSLWTAGTGSNIYRLSGYVGIGTNSPSSTLHVIGTTTADTFCIGASCIDEWSSGSGDVSSVSADNSTLTINPTIGVVKASLNLNNNNNWTGQQTFSEYVGIGTSSPLSKLHLFDNSSGPIISLSGLNTNYRGLTTRDLNNNEKWFMGNNDSNNFVIRRNGEVDDLSISSSTGDISINNSLTADSLNLSGEYGIAGIVFPDSSIQTRAATNRIFIGTTTTAYAGGSLGGFQGANDKCNQAFPGSYMCSEEDIINTINLQGIAVFPSNMGMWYNKLSNNGIMDSYYNNETGELSTVRIRGNCLNWQMVDYTDDTTGVYWYFDGSSFYRFSSSLSGYDYVLYSTTMCSFQLPLACCK